MNNCKLMIARVNVTSRYSDENWKTFRGVLRDSVDYIKEFTGGEVSYKLVDPQKGILTFSWHDGTNFDCDKILRDLKRMFALADFELLE